MNVKLRNRRSLQSLMNEYVNSVVVSPTLVKQICEEEVNESYLNYLTELNKKLDHMKQNDMQKLPSCAESAPELEKLRTKAVSRIKEFLLQKINALKKPKTNLQILQRNVLVKYKFFNTFLSEHHPVVAEEVRQHYVATMSAVYSKQFRTYVTSLQRLELENGPTKSDLLVTVEANTAASQAGRFLEGLGLSRGTNLKEKGNVFSLSGRDAILKELEKDPIIAHTQKDKAKYYYEQLFRSHQMLLMDTATSEFLFLNDFFDTRGDHRLFTDVFGRTQQFFLDQLEAVLANCWDSVGLLLMIRIVDFNRKCMIQRQVNCMDSYLDALTLLLWPRMRAVLEANVSSLRRAYQQLPVPANTHPHLITRRYAELAASLCALSSTDVDSPMPDTLHQPLADMQREVSTLMKAMAAKVEGGSESGLVFLINNVDLILTVFHERSLPRSATAIFDEEIRTQSGLFVENQVTRHFPNLVSFVKAAEPLVQDLEEPSSRASASGSGPPKGIDVQQMENVVKHFAQNWKSSMDAIHRYVMQSFTNFSNGMEILKQVLTQMLLYYTRLQKVIHKSFPAQPPAFAHELVTNSVIVMEIKQVTRSF